MKAFTVHKSISEGIKVWKDTMLLMRRNEDENKEYRFHPYSCGSYSFSHSESIPVKDSSVLKKIKGGSICSPELVVVDDIDFEYDGGKPTGIIPSLGDSTSVIVLWELGFIFNGLVEDNSKIKVSHNDKVKIIAIFYNWTSGDPFCPWSRSSNFSYFPRILAKMEIGGEIVVPRTLTRFRDFYHTHLIYQETGLSLGDEKMIERSAWAENLCKVITLKERP